MRTIQTAGTYVYDCYTLILSFTDNHAITLDGLSREDMLELQSCVNLMLSSDENTTLDLRGIVQSIYLSGNTNDKLDDDVVTDYVNQILEVSNGQFCRCPSTSPIQSNT
jgi:aerobic-type carbon monoxide dehydrogenase small subunit (CoxS/CutS family)